MMPGGTEPPSEHGMSNRYNMPNGADGSQGNFMRQNSFGTISNAGSLANQSLANAGNTHQSQYSQEQQQAVQKVHRKPPVIQKKQLPIDEQYEKWARFENFLKFAEKKEVRDRLKELDPPPLSNYIDPSTIDAIQKARRDPASLVKKPSSGAKRDEAAEKAHNLDKNKKRIQKMKEMYNMFIKMEKAQ